MTAPESLAPGAPFTLRGIHVPRTFLSGAARGGDEMVAMDIGIAEGRIAFIEPTARKTASPWAEIACPGALVIPCFVEPHAHLDSTQIWTRTPNPDGSFAEAAKAMVADRIHHWSPEDMRRRMEFGLACAHAYGVRAMRTHLASQNDQVEQRWEIFAELRAAWKGRVELQAVPLIALDALTEADSLKRITELVLRHDGVLGAFAPMAPGIDEALETLFAVAESHGLALDFHADENGDPDSDVLHRIAIVARAHGGRVPVNVGHCCSLAVQDEETAMRTLDLVAGANISVTALPGCNLYLQDREAGRTPRRRGITLLHEMAARDIPLSIGGDNCRDPFHRYGDFNPLESFRDAVRIAHLDHPIGDWPRSVTTTPAMLVGGPQWLEPGEPADLLLYEVRSFDELLVRPWSRRRVVRHGAFIDADPPAFAELER